MPQLAPTPWLAILLFTWLIFLIILPPKILAHNLPNEPAPQAATKPKTESWSWPWH
uniref:ATP synthase complex subunit 8 n=1 Tax=Malthopsis jordani TaxID=215333 RepID=D3NQF1_9TELE|nr:ATPase subunit 8 [Malthopsis jordani]